MRGDAVREVAGRRAGEHLEPELERPRRRHRHHAVLVRQRRVIHRVVLDVELARAEPLRQAIAAHQRRVAGVEAGARLAGDRQQLAVAPQVLRPALDVLARQVNRAVVVHRLERARGTYRTRKSPRPGTASYRDDIAVQSGRSHSLRQGKRRQGKFEMRRSHFKVGAQDRRGDNCRPIARDGVDVADDGDRRRVTARASASDDGLARVLGGDQRRVMRPGRAGEDRVERNGDSALPTRSASRSHSRNRRARFAGSFRRRRAPGRGRAP